MLFFFFFFNDTATTEIYTLSLHDALPILNRPYSIFSIRSSTWTQAARSCASMASRSRTRKLTISCWALDAMLAQRSEEHTSELQSQSNLVCRLLLEKKKKLQEDTRHTKV